MSASILEVRLAMIKRGYTPIPVIGKKPPLDEWQKTKDVTRSMLESWNSDWPAASNTGLITRVTPTIDLDVLNEPAALAAEELVRARFAKHGHIMVRIGQPPKRAIPFRVLQPFKKLTTNFVTPAGMDTEKVEFLCDGQQFVAHGVHPVTHKSYVWFDGDPTMVAYDDLPCISVEEACQLQSDVAALLCSGFGYVIASVKRPAQGNGKSRGRTARSNSQRDRVWAETALDEECKLISAVPSGSRNDQLNCSAFNVYQIVWGNPGLLDEEMVRQRLFEAAEACGLVEDDGADACWATIESGAEGAKAQPRVRPQPQLKGPAAPARLDLSKADTSLVAGGLAACSVPDDELDVVPQAGPAVAARRVIQLQDGRQSFELDQVEEELVRHQGFGVYQHGGQLVRTVRIHTNASDSRSTLIWQLETVNTAHLFEVFSRIVEFQRYDRRSKAWVLADCPAELPRMYEGRRHWMVPPILGVVHTPQLRADGSLVTADGYDPGTRLMYRFDGEVFPPIPEHPTKDDALAALKLVEEQISTFPFRTDIDRAVALSLFLTALCRRGLNCAPIHAITSPAPRTGKSLLISLASILACGQTPPVIRPGKSDNEFHKTLAASLMKARPIIAIDNCTRPLKLDLLCTAVTEEQNDIRELGYSRNILVRSTSLLTATGNNLLVAGDLPPRTLLCMIDAEVERPEQRVFKGGCIKTRFRQRRGELVAALLTVLRAGRLAQAEISQEIERKQPKPIGGFEEWCAWVRNPLVWLGRADPVASTEASYESNAEREEDCSVVNAWHRHIGPGTELRTQGIIDGAEQRGTLGAYHYPELREALLLVAEQKGAPGKICAKRLGWWLRGIGNRPIDGKRIVKTKVSGGYPYWKLEIC